MPAMNRTMARLRMVNRRKRKSLGMNLVGLPLQLWSFR